MANNIYRGTTPPFKLVFNSIDLTGWSVYITFEQKRKQTPEPFEFTIMPDELEVISTGDNSCNVIFSLTQEQTLDFGEGSVEIQMRAYKDGAAIAGKKKSFSVKDILLDGVIPLEGD